MTRRQSKVWTISLNCFSVAGDSGEGGCHNPLPVSNFMEISPASVTRHTFFVYQGVNPKNRARCSMDYVDDEKPARDNRKGIWRGEIVPPWEWR